MADDHLLPPENISPTHIQDFIFVRELCEVYLLLDHISGRWDKTFPPTAPGVAPDALLANDSVSVEAICKIGWPVVGNPVERAQQAATLLLAKDRLNAASKPANGATIAFTLMVVGEENRQIVRSPNAKGRFAQTGAPVGAHGVDGPANSGQVPHQARAESGAGWLGEHRTPPTRMYLAHKAFPGLINAATEFRQRISTLVYSLVAFLVVTCLLSWYAAVGNIILTHLDTVHAQEREIGRKIGIMVSSSLADNLKRSAAPAGSSFGDALVPRAQENLDIPSRGDPVNSAEACRAYFGNILDRSKSAEPFYICDTLDEKIKEHDAIGANLSRWLFWKSAWPGPKIEPHANNEEFSRIMTQLLVSSVLPFFYGILGAGAAVLRDLWSKMRESCLSPRDSTLAYGQLALGAIIGACISLFISPSIAGSPNESILGGFLLTGSALSFVAGFGVEGVFQALESLVRRIFNNPDPTKKR